MTTLNVRVDESLKKQASELFADLGLDMSTAVNMFLRQAVMKDGLPFDVVREVPNAETLAAMAEVEEMKKHPEKYKSYTDVDEMFRELLK
jgi:addiction module antitoxin, RelB/DinJ family